MIWSLLNLFSFGAFFDRIMMWLLGHGFIYNWAWEDNDFDCAVLRSPPTPISTPTNSPRHKSNYQLYRNKLFGLKGSRIVDSEDEMNQTDQGQVSHGQSSRLSNNLSASGSGLSSQDLESDYSKGSSQTYNYQILTLTTGGDNVLNHLLGGYDVKEDQASDYNGQADSNGPTAVYSVDLNVYQNYLLELKMAVIASCERHEFIAIFLLSRFELFKKYYKSKIRPHLSPSAAVYWDTASAQRSLKNFAQSGWVGYYCKVMIGLCSLLGIKRLLLIPLLQCSSIIEQRKLYKRVRWLAVIFSWIIFYVCDFLLPFIGVPQAQVNLYKTHVQPDQPNKPTKRSNFVLQVIDYMFNNVLVSKNPFYLGYMYGTTAYIGQLSDEGMINDDSLFRYMRKNNYDIVKSRLNRIHIITGNLLTVLRDWDIERKGKIDYFFLLDHMDWMDESMVLQEMSYIQRVFNSSNPNARIVFRSFSQLLPKQTLHYLDVLRAVNVLHDSVINDDLENEPLSLPPSVVDLPKKDKVENTNGTPYVLNHANLPIDRVGSYFGFFVCRINTNYQFVERANMKQLQQSENHYGLLNPIINYTLDTAKDLQVLYNMLLRPLVSSPTDTLAQDKKTDNANIDHANFLEFFYRSQANLYDHYRQRMLHGRSQLMTLLPVPAFNNVSFDINKDEKNNLDDTIVYESGPYDRLNNRYNWLDVGGATGYNLQELGYFLKAYDSVDVVDLCPSLLAVCNQKKNNNKDVWKNVNIIESDITLFNPDNDKKYDIITLSYSLTMIPNWEEALEKCVSLLKPNGRLFITDFTVIDNEDLEGKFWRWLFKHDHIQPNHFHRSWLKQRLHQEYCVINRGGFPWVPLLRAPYYVAVYQNNRTLADHC